MTIEMLLKVIQILVDKLQAYAIADGIANGYGDGVFSDPDEFIKPALDAAAAVGITPNIP